MDAYSLQEATMTTIRLPLRSTLRHQAPDPSPDPWLVKVPGARCCCRMHKVGFHTSPAATNTIVPASPDIDGPDALLPSGLIFIGGGVNSQAVNQKPILYDPSTDQIIAVPAMDKPFDLASSVLLNDGRVLVIGRDRTNS